MWKKKEPTPEVPGVDKTLLLAALKEGHREFLRYAVHRTKSLVEAEDVLQDFYLKAVRGAGAVRDRASLKSWLAQVLRRTLTDHYRRAATRKRGQERLVAAEVSTLQIGDDADRAVCACLYRVLPALLPEYAQIIWRIDLLGQRRDEVAKSLGITSNNLGVRIHRSRRALRGALERFCVTCPVHGFLNCACDDVWSGLGRRVPDLHGSGVIARFGSRLLKPRNG